ncbi:homogentisate 1,2-dioxygenase [Actinoplanes sp. LDG1-06]|uniref:Homogentisate 1,2-dioxygenase n=1 Tax=Paractinoplanes ovalisporus TaxID=2810368 RepID=A0ABS2ABS9_9ACTN|nr:homogentisate 1,2-dioxygenase [Actinoplanes ovalisporus]MBM2617248.1 homogentisate 1,2-dioxygenase [Actinoplanes ovalisporus]
MPYYRSVGEVPHKRHTQFRRPDGGLYAEELMGQEGFSSDSSLLYHRHAPTAIVSAETYEAPKLTRSPNLPLKPRHLRTHKLDAGPADAVLGRHPLMANDDVRIGYAVADRPSPLYRDAVGDEMLYIEDGRVVVETTFGTLDAGTGDYVIIPTSVVHRIVPVDGPARLLTIEATGHIGPPKRYLSVRGQFLEHAPYCERDQRAPAAPLQVDETDVEVLVKHRAGWTRHVYAHHPFDVVGWDGCLYPWAFSIHDFEPITGRVHQPPPVHQTFEGPNFVVCSFVPRKVDYHPLAIPVPYNHHNVDSDEMMFYTGGNYEARRGSGIDQGSISLHPSGFTHGPQPGAVERALGVEAFDELAVMVDTFRPLDLCDAALAVEDTAYAWTWNR